MTDDLFKKATRIKQDIQWLKSGKNRLVEDACHTTM